METGCEGLSLALFIFSIAGNVTYVLSICTESFSARHLVANASWLAGSGGTVLLDIVVSLQSCFAYRGTHYVRRCFASLCISGCEDNVLIDSGLCI